jgi:hypothetical protein
MDCARLAPAPGVMRFYAEWLPDRSGVAEARVELQSKETTHTVDHTVYLNMSDAVRLKAPTERLALIHATMWHEVAHVRHPLRSRWLDLLIERHAAPATSIEFAFQALEDLRIERELLCAHRGAKRWLRYNLEHAGGIVHRALSAGKDRECGWPLSATIYAGRVVAGVIGDGVVERLAAADDALGSEISALRGIWQSYAVITDGERDSGEGEEQVTTLARRI